VRYDDVVKRRVLTILLFLLLGAIVNIAVAWRYGMHWGFPEKPLTSTDSAERSVVDVVIAGVTLIERNLQTGSWESGAWSVHQELEAGIPFRSMRASRIDRCSRTVDRDSLWEPNLPFLGRRVLPCGILPVGFGVNTLFYAAILLLLFAAPFALRRRRRIKRGLCPACAYPVGESPICTECGKQRPSPSR
jgi:hypothetical protein